MPQLQTGALVTRLIPSTTGRDIKPGDVGRIDDYQSADRYFPVKWTRTGLWSMLHTDDLDSWYKLVKTKDNP